MKRYLATFGLLAFTGALLSLQANTIQSYAANSTTTVMFNSADHFLQDTTPRSDTSSKKHKKMKGGKMKGDSTWSKTKRDSLPR